MSGRYERDSPAASSRHCGKVVWVMRKVVAPVVAALGLLFAVSSAPAEIPVPKAYKGKLVLKIEHIKPTPKSDIAGETGLLISWQLTVGKKTYELDFHGNKKLL